MPQFLLICATLLAVSVMPFSIDQMKVARAAPAVGDRSALDALIWDDVMAAAEKLQLAVATQVKLC